MFKAFNAVHKVREELISTLDLYPEMLATVERLLTLYAYDGKLEQKAMSLYVALLVAVEGMIVWFQESMSEFLRTDSQMEPSLDADFP